MAKPNVLITIGVLLFLLPSLAAGNDPPEKDTVGVGIVNNAPCECIDNCERDVVSITVSIDVEDARWLVRPRWPTEGA